MPRQVTNVIHALGVLLATRSRATDDARAKAARPAGLDQRRTGPLRALAPAATREP